MTENNNPVFCTNCGAQNDSNDKFCSACGNELKNKVLPSKSNAYNTYEQTNIPTKHIILSVLIFIVLFATIAICSGMNLDEVDSAIWRNDYRPSWCGESIKFIIPGSIIAGLCACVSRIFIKNILFDIGIIVFFLIAGFAFRQGLSMKIMSTTIFIEEVYSWYLVAAGVYFIAYLIVSCYDRDLFYNTSQPKIKKCPGCHSELDYNIEFCPMCGHSFKSE